MKRKPEPAGLSVCQEAEKIVRGARRQSYGDALFSHERIAKLWSALLGCPVTAEQVALCMIALKLARHAHAPKRDNLVDVAGYALCLEEIAKTRAKEGHFRR